MGSVIAALPFCCILEKNPSNKSIGRNTPQYKCDTMYAIEEGCNNLSSIFYISCIYKK